MAVIHFPDNFPSTDNMIGILKKTFEGSWKVNLDSDDINSWLNNFNGIFFSKDAERRLALWLLCNFTYYNSEDVNHLCSVLFNNLIHRLMVDMSLTTSQEAQDCIKNTSFTSIGSASESGGLIIMVPKIRTTAVKKSVNMVR